MNKRISVIIPCYNAGKYITDCLDSLIAQTIGIENMDIIIVNDASVDNSWEIITKYENAYPQSITAIMLEENGGQANARNIGIEWASAPYLSFVDADDWVDHDIYERMLEPTREEPCDLIQCSRIEHIEGLTPFYKPLEATLGIEHILDETDRKRILNNKVFSGVIGCSVFRTDWIRKNHFRFKSFQKYEDNYFWGIMKYSFESYYAVSEGLYHYRILESSNSHARNDVRHFARLQVELEKINYYHENNLYDVYYDEIRDSFLELFYTNTLHIICCQFDYIPLEVIESMQAAVRELYPNYLEEYCKKKTLFINPILTVAFDFPLQVWEKYKEAYLKWTADDKEEEIAKFYISMRKSLG